MSEVGQLPIAVVGVSSLMPGSADVEGFWRDIVHARDLITEVPPTHWLVDDYYDPDPAAPGKTYAHRGAFIPDIAFDPTAFGLPPAVLPATDTSQLLALVAAEQLLTNIAAATPLDRERVSVILGSSALPLLGEMSMASGRPHWLKGLRESGIPEPQAQQICDRIAANYVSWQENTFPGLLSNVVAGRIANRFDLGGTNCTVDAACASALAALSVAVGELTLGHADMVITGAVDTLNDHTTYQCFSKTRALSPTGDCRPFSEHADGTMLGEGVAMFALKRLTDAERDGNRIYAVIRGVGSSSDGRGTAIYAPLPEGQVAALRRAYRAAGYSPDTVDLIEAHGTGTAAGDIAEVTALRQVFSADRGHQGKCALGSVKSQIGHTKACAGGAGLLKAVLALHHKVLPPTLKVDRPNPALHLEDSAFYLNTAVRPWIHHAAHPRRASVSSFGFGGTNFHVTVEEYQPAVDRPEATGPRMHCLPAELVLLSAPNSRALLDKLNAIDLTQPLPDLAHSTRHDFSTSDTARLAIVAADISELGEKLTLARTVLSEPAGSGPRPTPGLWCDITRADPGAIAFLFPGQGAQYVGMGADLAMNFPPAQQIWDSAHMQDASGTTLADVVFPRPARTEAEREHHTARLTATEWAQPALAQHSLAILELLRTVNLHPDALAGHSAGELTALHAAGTFDADALRALARRRGELMHEATQEALTAGAMLAVSADAERVTAVTAAISDVWLVNFNGPLQVVLSGPEPAIAQAETVLAANNIATRRLRTATAFHSPLVAPASAPLREFLNGTTITPPTRPVYASADAALYPSDHDEIRDRIATQLAMPVHFTDQIERMYQAGVRTFIEVGAGAALSTLVDSILGDRTHLAVSTDRHGRNGVRSFLEALGALCVGGVHLDAPALWAHYTPISTGKPTSVTTSKPKMRVTINGTNFGRPYPPPGGSAQLPPPNPAADNHHTTGISVAISGGDHTNAGWAQFLTEVHRQSTEIHAAYQHSTTEAHSAYMRTTDAAVNAMTRLLNADRPDSRSTETQPTTAPPHTHRREYRVEAPDSERPPLPTTVPVDDAASTGGRSSTAAASPGDSGDLAAVLLSVVADKTGYPVEVLDSDMDMEADLGIDSIKRVEILAAMREHVPALEHSQSTDLSQLGSLRTLDDVLTALAELPNTAHPPGIAYRHDGDRSIPHPVTRFVVHTIDAPPTGHSMPGLTDGTIAIIDDGAGVAPLLVTELAHRGVTSTVVHKPPHDCNGVVFLGGLRAPETISAAMDMQREAFGVAKTLAPRFTFRPSVFVTVQHTGGDFGLSGADPARAWMGGLAGLSRTVRHEWPNTAVKAIDCALDTPHTIAAAIADELTAGGPEVNVGLSLSGRTTIHTTETSIAAPACDWLPTAPVIVASGGARGITAKALIALAEQYRCRLLLLGRTALDSDSNGDGASGEIHANLTRLRATGAEVRYLPLDIRDSAAVTDAVAQARRDWGPITAIVHGAGTLADKLLTDKTLEQFTEVFSTKVDGLHALLTATASDPLRVICLFSSVVGHHGNRGQCDYAMANATLSSVAAAEAARRPDCLVRSLGWGPWAAGMVTAPVAELLSARGIPLIPADAGSRAFVDELHGPVIRST